LPGVFEHCSANIQRNRSKSRSSFCAGTVSAGGARYDSEDHEYKRYMPNYQLSESILHHRI